MNYYKRVSIYVKEMQSNVLDEFFTWVSTFLEEMKTNVLDEFLAGIH